MLRQQRILGNPSPALSLPSRLDPPLHPGPPKPPRHPLQGLDRRTGDGGAASDGEIEQRTRRQQFERSERGVQQQTEQEQAKKQPRRRESHSRRHTLQNGIDYGLVN